MLIRTSLILFILTSLQQEAAAAGHDHIDDQSITKPGDVDQIVTDQLSTITSKSI